MNISDIITKCYILALIIRDDGERLLLGDGFYEFKEQLQHFQPNIFQNDVIELQGSDGQLLAGQVRRGATQSFDGFIADATISREATEEHRQRFLGFFLKKHHYKVVYVFPDGSAIKRERGYIVDAPSVPEMFQRFPEFHVGLNFEDVNYYEYEEGEDGEEIFAHVQNIAIAGYVEGGLIWDNYGAVSNEITWVDYALKTTTDGYAQITDGVLGAPINLEQLFGNTTQFTTTGKNLFGASQASRTDNGVTSSISDGIITLKNTTTASGTIGIGNQTIDYTPEGGDTYTFTIWLESGSATFTLPDDCGFYIRKPDGTAYASNASIVMSKIRQYGYQSTTFTAPDATPMRFLISANKAGITFNNVVLRVQVEKSSSRTDWEPYTGKAASPSPSYPQTVNVVSNEQEVRITKNNLLPAPADWSQNVNGLQIDCVNGVYKLQGRASSGSSSSLYNLKEPYTVRHGDYFHLGNTITDSHVNVQFIFADGIGAGIVGSPSEIGRIISLDQYEGRTLNRVRCNFNPNFDLDIVMKPMILHDIATATEFEPYQGQSYKINLGKNLIPFTNQDFTVNSVRFYVQNGTLYLDGACTSETLTSHTQFKNNFAFTLEAGTYTFSMGTSGTLRPISLKKYSDDSNISSLSSVQMQTTFTLSEQTQVYIGFYLVSGNSYSNTKYEVQIERGSIKTDFAPYKTPIELCKIGTYQDYIYEDDGEWYKHAEIYKIEWNGTEAWQQYNSNVYLIAGTYPAGTGTSSGIRVLDGICNRHIFTNSNNDITYNSAAHTGFEIRNLVSYWGLATATVADWKTWLQSHNIVIYNALATPTDTKITDQELIQQLSTIKALVGEMNNIFLIPSAGEQGEMEVRYSRGFINQGAGYVWDAAQGGGPNVVSVNGIDRTGFVWEVVGPATNPTLTNITTNQTMTFEGDVATGQTLIVNTSDQTAEIAGTNVFAQMEGDWMQLAPGNNVITYTATGATESSKIKWNGVVG